MASNPPDVNGQRVSLVTTAIAAVVALVTAFHLVNISDLQNAAIMGVAVTAVGLGIYVWGLIRSWATASYDLPRATTLVTAFVAAVVALLDAFGVFHFDAAQQTALLGVTGGIAFLGGLVFSYLHTTHQLMQLEAFRLAQKMAPSTRQGSQR